MKNLQASRNGGPAWLPNRRQLLLLAAAKPLDWATPQLHGLVIPTTPLARPMSVIEALEACGTDAENFHWAFEVNACLGYRQVMFTTGRARGSDAGGAAACLAIRESDGALRNAPGAALVVRGRYPDVLTHREAFNARQEVRAVARLDAYVLYALCPDHEAGDEIEVSLAIAVQP